MTDQIHADQNLRLAAKMLEQQGEINALKRERDALKAECAALVDAFDGDALDQITALRAECAALAEALDDGRHEHDPVGWGDGRCRRRMLPASAFCWRPADDQVHRTSAWVRANHGHGAT